MTGNAVLRVRATQNDPNGGSPTWTDWQRLDSAEFDARGFDFELDLKREDQSYSIRVSGLDVLAEQVT